jgi:hypothetical protein
MKHFERKCGFTHTHTYIYTHTCVFVCMHALKAKHGAFQGQSGSGSVQKNSLEGNEKQYLPAELTRFHTRPMRRFSCA